MLLSGSITPRAGSRADALLQQMTPDQKIGQLFLVTICARGLNDQARKFVQDSLPGGAAIFNCNGDTPEELTATINAWQLAATTIGAKIPLFMAIDQEGASVRRLEKKNGFSSIPGGWALGAMPAADAAIVGRIAAEELRAIGLNMNLAPIADVQTIRSNPLMDRRTFGSDPANVAAKTIAYQTGLNGAGVIGVLKHFPGHGDAADSHALLPVVDYDRARAIALMQPFADGAKAGADVIMVGHLVYPALDPARLPASLSKPMITGILREQFGFAGVVMTDAMDMGAMADHFERGQAAVLSIQAGVDIITSGPHLPIGVQTEMIQAVRAAVASGTISPARLDESVRRILALKEKYGLLDWAPLDERTAGKRVDPERHRAELVPVWQHTVTIGGRLPIKPDANTALIGPGIYPAAVRECRALDANAATYAYSQRPTDIEIATAAGIARKADRAIVFTYDAVYEPKVEALLRAIPADKLVIAPLQNPYDITLVPGIAGYAASYLPGPAPFRALCGAIYGVSAATGVLPIAVR